MMDMEMNAELERDDESETGEPSSEGSSAESFFCALEEDYAKIKNEMRENEELAKYEAEYARLFEVLYRAHKTEQSLLEQRQTLQEEVESTNKKVVELESLLSSYSAKIDVLNDEIEFSRKMVDDANNRELKALEDSNNLKVMITNLEKELEQMKSQVESQAGDWSEQNKDNSFAEKDTIMGEMEALKYNYQFANDQIKELQNTVNTLKQEKSELEESLDTKINEFIEERRLREKTDGTVKKLSEENKDIKKKLQLSHTANEKSADTILKLTSVVKEKNVLHDNIEKERNKLMQENQEFVTKIDALRYKNEKLNGLLLDKKKEALTLNAELNRLSEMLSKVKTEKETLVKKMSQTEVTLESLKNDLRRAKLNEENRELEYTALTKSLREEQTKVDNLTKTVEELNKSVTSSKSVIVGLKSELQTSKTTQHKLQTDFDDLSKSYNTLTRYMSILTNKRDKLVKEVQELKYKIEDQKDEIKEQGVEVENYKRASLDFEAKYRLQQNTIATLNTEKMSQKKMLQEAQDDVDNVKNQLKLLNDQIKFHKDQISVRDNVLHQYEFKLGKAEKDKEDLTAKLQKTQDTVKSLRKDMDDMKKVEKELRIEIETMTLDSNKRKKEMESLKTERDNASSDLARQINEMNNLNQKMKVMETLLQRGQVEYTSRLDEIRLLKLEVKKIRSERDLLIKKIKNSSDLRREVLQLHRKLTKERIKVTALAEETENPVNVHRWRQLEGTDDIIGSRKKISALNQRILKLSTKLIKMENYVKEVEEKSLSLQEIVNKQCKPELTKELIETKLALKQKDKKIQSLLGEIGVWMRSKDEHKMEKDKLNQELRDIKEKYYALKRKQQISLLEKNDEQKEMSNDKEPKGPSNDATFGCGNFIMTSISFDT